MFSDAPPSRDEVTTSRTCADWVDVKTFTSSGMIAPARVPHVITVDSCHQSDVFPPSSGMSSVREDVGEHDRHDRGHPDEQRQRRLEVHARHASRSAPR